MNKFALTTVAALPGSGGGCVSKLAPEIDKRGLWLSMRAQRMAHRMTNAMTAREYEGLWKEIVEDAELEEYFSSRN